MTTSIQIYKQDADWLALKENPTLLKQRIGMMLVGGKNLGPHQIDALMAYSLANDLNPFNLECYPTEMGVMPGVQGYRRKATEQLAVEAELSGFEGAYYTVTFEHATQDEAQFNPEAGDIAYKATLEDVISTQKWRKEVAAAAKELEDIREGIPFFELMEAARGLVGPKPTWQAVGVVFGAEEFIRDPSKRGKQYEWDRHERAKKRAEKAALKKRFTGLRLSGVRYNGEQVTNGDVDDNEPAIDVEYEEEAPAPKKIHRPADAIMGDLGLDVTPGQATKRQPLTREQAKQAPPEPEGPPMDMEPPQAEDPEQAPAENQENRAAAERLIRDFLGVRAGVPVTAGMCQVVLDNMAKYRRPEPLKKDARRAADYLIGLIMDEEQGKK